MFPTMTNADGSQKYLSKYLLHTFLLPALMTVTGSCAREPAMTACSYIDAFGSEQTLADLTIAKAHLDAKRFVQEGRVALMGGYLETGPLTIPLRESSDEYPSQNIRRLIEKYGLGRIEKLYPTKMLNSNKAGNILRIDDGYFQGNMVEEECYNPDIRWYAIEFNRILFIEALRE